MKGKFKLNLFTKGSVAKEEVSWVTTVVLQLYHRSPIPVPPLVELVVVDTLARRREMMGQEEKLLGIHTGEDFPATHEAWWGKPRIIACMESLKKLPPVVAKASLQVAAAHSILHGTREHYLFRIPAEAVRRGRERGWTPEQLERLLYLVASAVKNLAAGKFLVRCRYVAEHAALALNQLELESAERSLWPMVEKDAKARTIYLAALLRPILFAYPVIAYSPYVAEAVMSMTAHLPQQVGWRLRALAMEIAYAFPGESRSFVNPAFEMVWRRLVEEKTP